MSEVKKESAKERDKKELNIAEVAAKRRSYRSRTSQELKMYLEEKGFEEDSKTL